MRYEVADGGDVEFVRGEEVAQEVGSRLIGPILKGISGRVETVTRNGQTGTVGADSIRESILEPQAATVQGYGGVPMAAYGGVLIKEQMEGLIVFPRDVE